MSDDEADHAPVPESAIGRALKEQCKFDKEMLGFMKVCLFLHFVNFL